MQPSPLQRKLRHLLATPECDRAVVALILISVVLLFLEVAYPTVEFFVLAGNAILWCFALELALRFHAAPSKRAFFRNYWVDLLALLPLLGTGRALTALRLLRLLRLGPMLMRTTNRFGMMLRQTLGEQVFILNLILVFVLGIGLGLLAVEGRNPSFNTAEKAIWWSLFSMIAGEPIGEMPTTFIGRLLALGIMLGGLTVFALFTGTVSAVMADRLRQSGRGIWMTTEDLAGHIVICGWNRSGRLLLEELRHSEHTRDLPIAVIAEKKPDFTPAQELDPNILFQDGDYTNVELLKRVRVERATRAILLADKSNPQRNDQDRDARTILAALIIEKLNPGIFCCAELLSRENEPHLLLAGVEEVAIADEYSATILAASTPVQGVTEIVDEILSAQYGNQFFKLAIPARWVGTGFVEVQQEAKRLHDAIAIAVESAPVDSSSRQTDKLLRARTVTNPPSDYAMKAGDKLIVIARKEPKW